MPLYDFLCKECGHRFDDLVPRASDAKCLSCGSGHVERLISVFGVGGSSGKDADLPVGPCGTCGDPRGPGSCRMDGPD